MCRESVRIEPSTGTVRTECQGGNNWATQDLRDNQWHHIVSLLPDMQDASNDDVKHFVDGVLDPQLDEAGRIRIDDLEMQADIQAKVVELWNQITTDNLNELSDYAGYQRNFLNLFGFELPGVDYEEDVEVDLPMPSEQ